MSKFRECRESLLYIVMSKSFVYLMTYINTSKNPDSDYTCYNKFDLSKMCNDDEVVEF